MSDQKEQDLLTVAIDLHYGRQVRHLERLARPHAPGREALGAAGRGAAPGAERGLPDRPRPRGPDPVGAGQHLHRELHERLDRQLERIGRYYGDLRAEVEEQAERPATGDEDPAKFAARREALEREEQLRIGELRRKSS